jgi:hypothetical protein
MMRRDELGADIVLDQAMLARRAYCDAARAAEHGTLRGYPARAVRAGPGLASDLIFQHRMMTERTDLVRFTAYIGFCLGTGRARTVPPAFEIRCTVPETPDEGGLSTPPFTKR